MRQVNENRPGYKQTPLGWIPDKWQIVELESCFTLSSGKTKPEDINDTSIGDYLYPVYGGNGIVGYSKQFNIEGENIIIGRVGEYCGITRYLSSKAWVTDNALMTKRIDETYDPSYLAYKLQQENISRLRSKGGQPLVSQMPIYLHIVAISVVKSEQKKIADILSTWDNAIAKAQQLIIQIQQLNKGLMQKLLTGKKRVKGFEGRAWVKLPANEIFVNSSVKNNGNQKLLSATQDRGIIPRDMLEARVTMPVGETAPFKLVEKGDFVISLRSFQGGIEYSEYKGLVSPAYTVLKPLRDINTLFYKCYFKSYDFIGHLAVAVIGIRDGKQISYDDFSILKIPYPSVDEQEAIAAILNISTTKLFLYEKKLSTLQLQKKGLMQKLLTGEIRVKL